MKEPIETFEEKISRVVKDKEVVKPYDAICPKVFALPCEEERWQTKAPKMNKNEIVRLMFTHYQLLFNHVF